MTSLRTALAALLVSLCATQAQASGILPPFTDPTILVMIDGINYSSYFQFAEDATDPVYNLVSVPIPSVEFAMTGTTSDDFISLSISGSGFSTLGVIVTQPQLGPHTTVTSSSAQTVVDLSGDGAASISSPSFVQTTLVNGVIVLQLGGCVLSGAPNFQASCPLQSGTTTAVIPAGTMVLNIGLDLSSGDAFTMTASSTLSQAETPVPVPEPGTLSLIGLGLAMLRRRVGGHEA